MNSVERRNAIIEAARPILAANGYYATSTADIARASGCSEALLYRHFPSKHALLIAVLEEGTVIAEQRLHAQVVDADDPFGALCAGLSQLAGDPEFRDVLRVRAQAATQSQDPTLRRMLGEVRQRHRGVVLDAIAASKARGHIRPEVDEADLERVYSGLSFMAAFSIVLENEEETAGQQRAAMALAEYVRP